MKHIVLQLFALAILLHASAAVPLQWTVDVSRVKPEVRDVVRGETVVLEATLQSGGKPFATGPEPVCIFWQTNGMGSAWWSRPCVATASSPSGPTNVLSATFTPEMDPGAASVIGFLGSSGSIYRAAFQLRFRHGPGALPNALPLPTPVIDFARVTVLNPPWSGGGSGGVDTNAVIDIVHKTVDGSARYTPKYLWIYDCADSYPEDAAAYYRSRGDGRTDGGCSAVRDGGFIYRNFDFPFDERAEFVVKMSAGPNRFASVGVAQVGMNLTEQIVTSGKPSRWYKALPGATVDGINEHGVVAEINVVDGDPQWRSGILSASDIHPLAAVRWILDNATSAGMAASNLVARIKFPSGWRQNFHWMIADERETWFVENGHAVIYDGAGNYPVLTNFGVLCQLGDEWRYLPLRGKEEHPNGSGFERLDLFQTGANVTNAWYTNAYRRETNPPWVSDLAEVIAYTNDIFDAWAAHDKDYFRGRTNGGQPWWQSVHTSIYDITNRTLRVCVQEVDDWYTFSVPSSGGGVKPETVREIVQPMLDGKFSREGGTIIKQEEMLESAHVDVRSRSGGGVRIEAPNAGIDPPKIDMTPNGGGGVSPLIVLHDSDAPETYAGQAEVIIGDMPVRSTIGQKRDLTNNGCVASSFGPWNYDPYDEDVWIEFRNGRWVPEGHLGGGAELGDENSTDLTWIKGVDWGGSYDLHATRQRVATSGETFVTKDYVDEHSSPPSPTLRVYDDVQSCWWIGRMVNGVMSWEVE